MMSHDSLRSAHAASPMSTPSSAAAAAAHPHAAQRRTARGPRAGRAASVLSQGVALRLSIAAIAAALLWATVSWALA